MKHYRTSKPRSGGFTLLEIMLAMGIFVVGFVSIASIYIAAAFIQKQTVDEVTTRDIGNSVEPVLISRPLTTTDVAFYHTTNSSNRSDLEPIMVSTYATPLDNKWSIGDRSYPVLDANDGTNELTRTYYWVPLLRDSNGDATSPSWQIYVMILRRSFRGAAQYAKTPAADYANPDDPAQLPSVKRVLLNITTPFDSNNYFFDNDPSILAEGDWLVDNNGQIYRVVESSTTGVTVGGLITPFPNTPFEIWIGEEPTGGGKNPLKRIEIYTKSDLVVAP